MKIKFLLFVQLINVAILFGQKQVSKNQYNTSNKIHQEKIFLHYNTNFLITGESLNYKIYCLDFNSNLFSNLSKIAYVEIIDSDNNTIEKQKIKLTNGIGAGDFFIDTKLASKNYKLIAYTEWMKNKNIFFSDELSIYNPFTTIDKNLVSITKKMVNKENSKTINSNFIALEKKVFKSRERVTLNLKNLENGNYSISVRKYNPTISNKKLLSSNFNKKIIQENSTNNNTVFLPDFRGELIQGKLSSKTNKNLKDIKVGLSVVQKNGISKISNSDKNGYFYFNLIENYGSNPLHLQVITNDNHKYNIKIIKKNPLNLSKLKFSKLNFSKEIYNEIKQRSINVQIENAYNTLKQDLILERSNHKSFFRQSSQHFVLDEYKRFKTVKETIVEVIKSTWLTKKGDNYQFHVRDQNMNTNTNLETLVIIDGYIIKNHNELVEFNTNMIKIVHVFRDKYNLNSKLYQGVIYIETFKENFAPKINKDILVLNLKSIFPKKKYFTPNYTKVSSSRIPDYRTQLFWDPELNIKKSVKFYTSDVKGNYEIEIEGFTNKGKPISIKEIFSVN